MCFVQTHTCSYSNAVLPSDNELWWYFLGSIVPNSSIERPQLQTQTGNKQNLMGRRTQHYVQDKQAGNLVQSSIHNSILLKAILYYFSLPCWLFLSLSVRIVWVLILEHIVCPQHQGCSHHSELDWILVRSEDGDCMAEDTWATCEPMENMSHSDSYCSYHFYHSLHSTHSWLCTSTIASLFSVSTASANGCCTSANDNRPPASCTCKCIIMNSPFSCGEVGKQMKSMTFPSGDSSCLQDSFLRLKIDISAPLLLLLADEEQCPPE